MRLKNLILFPVALAFSLTIGGGRLMAQQASSNLPTDKQLRKEEQDTQALMDLQVREAERNSFNSEKLRQSQERVAALTEKFYEDLLNKQQGAVGMAQSQAAGPASVPQTTIGGTSLVMNPAGPAGAPQPQGGSRNSPFLGRALDVLAQEDGPEIARQRGLGFISMGSIVDIRILTRVNTSIPGPVIAQVVYDVMDVDQRMVVIPRGSKLVGQAAPMAGDTEGRGKVVFNVFVDPSGKEIPIAVPVVTANRIGVTGIDGDVDYHWARVFGGSAALAVITGISGGGQPSGNSINATQQDLIRQNLMQSTGNLSNQLLNRFIQIRPDITLEEGSSAKVIIVQAILAKPWQRIY